ncbi:MAG: MAPEG family protein [Burkholderiaceae bacterium]
MQLVELVAIIAVIQFLWFGGLTGNARRISGLKAPAITGDARFECMYRVQMNTLEMLVPFFPALFIAANYWPGILVAATGAVYVVGRFLYWRAYVSDPSTRGLGFMLSLIPIAVLVVLALLGSTLSLLGLR